MSGRWQHSEGRLLSTPSVIVSVVFNVIVFLLLGLLIISQPRSSDKTSIANNRPSVDEPPPSAQDQSDAASQPSETTKLAEQIAEPISKELMSAVPAEIADEKTLAELNEEIKQAMMAQAVELARQMLDPSSEMTSQDIQQKISNIEGKAKRDLATQTRQWAKQMLSRKIAQAMLSEANKKEFVDTLLAELKSAGEQAATKAQAAAKQHLAAAKDNKINPKAALAVLDSKKSQKQIRDKYESAMAEKMRTQLQQQIEEAIRRLNSDSVKQAADAREISSLVKNELTKILNDSADKQMDAINSEPRKQSSSCAQGDRDKIAAQPPDGALSKKTTETFADELAGKAKSALDKATQKIDVEKNAANELSALADLAAGKIEINVNIKLAGQENSDNAERAEMAMKAAEKLKGNIFGSPGVQQSSENKKQTGNVDVALKYRSRIDESQYKAQTAELANRIASLQEGGKKREDFSELPPASSRQDNQITSGPERAVISRIPESAKPAAAQQSNRKLVKPDFVDKWFAGMTFLKAAPVADGDSSDWKDIPDSLKTGQMTVKLAYNAGGIWIFASCKDSAAGLQSAGTSNFWEGDCLEVWFDILEDKPERIYQSSGCHQFFFCPRANGNLDGFEVRHTGTEKSQAVPLGKLGYKGKCKVSSDGYDMEIFLPPDCLRGFWQGVKAGRFVGFNINLNNGRGGTSYFAGTDSVETSVRPKTWGDILNLGSDATINCWAGKFPDSSLPSSEYLAAGQIICVEVVDPDRNFDPSKKDTISAQVSSGCDSERISLMETAPDSGVFRGTLMSRIGDKTTDASDVLEVGRNDTVTIRYSDSVQSFGERNVPITRQMHVASPVYKISYRGKVIPGQGE